MKNHFVFSYAGNKRSEVEQLYYDITERVDLYDMEYIVEPFCGTSAMSYYIHTLHPMEFKYVLNDNNKHLIELYNILKSERLTKIFIDEIMHLIRNIDKEKHYRLIREDTVWGWYIKNKVFKFRFGTYPSDPHQVELIKLSISRMNECPIINFLRTEDITFRNTDAVDIMKEYGANDKAFIFLDPPYKGTYNHYYLCYNFDIYDFLVKNNINDMTARIFLALEDTEFVRDNFKKNYLYEPYVKIYGITNKKTNHVLITQA